jgi:uncharacterized membrane protein YqjE
MDSWRSTLRLLAVMAAIALFYVLGRWLAEVWRVFTSLSMVPSFGHYFP